LSFMAEKFQVTFHPSDIKVMQTVNDLVVAIEDLSLE
jgi:acyl carrier protein